jgi:hypothetical protein
MSPKQAGGESLLEAVCPGAVKTGKEIGCRTGCPDFTSFGEMGDRFDWSLGAVTRGHFRSATSDDAALWMRGCEPHSFNFGGTVLLTRGAEKWQMIWYKPAIQTESCHKVRLRGGREVLVCIGAAGSQGTVVTGLYVEDLLYPKPTLMAGEDGDGTFFSAFDSTLACGGIQGDEHKPFPLIRTHIDKVEFSTSKNGTPVVTVAARFGKKELTPEDVLACLAQQPGVLPRTRSYRMDFLFNGHGYKTAPWSAEAVRIFEAR